ncbi:branched-chain amino acid transport system II carrier protein [Staphylococcus sp. SQ8-PEA]|uniref:Branched-chain amino acid transport system carrier protein n=1 Tax=Staphylococcus marylandisciuri TaxID=2981529 RepID=A0ABT2QNH3_9STAP|nr:branched-chain amino acid transport system II carrier protein [Staphylococcus marylandisciuri]MCU5745536.1 branched-chain amino acid transport system II carrier protein [Staphylococcus marylandisciuri]
MNKNTWIIGFTLFAMFFGAGNLIFPPQLGLNSGPYFWPSITAFALTGIGLPLLAVIIGAIDKQGYIGALNKISPKFSVGFLIVIYLTIGPLFAIPRTASTSFEMTVTPITHTNSNIALFIFTIIYFLVVLYLCLNPNKMVDRVGALLTPLLLITIVALIIKGFIDFGSNTHSQPSSDYVSNIAGFSKGFTEGYLTMDAIAALAFSMIVVNAVKATGVKHADNIFKQTAIAGLMAAVGLIFIYICIGYIGNHMEVSPSQLKELNSKDQNIGTYLLTTMATNGFGVFGKYLLGIIVALACLTTGCGLTVSVSEYFHRIMPFISYKSYVLIFTLLGFILANLGLNSVIKMSEPVLMIIYPLAITVVLLIPIARLIPTKPFVQRFTLLIVGVVSIISVIHSEGWLTIKVIDYLPLKQYSLEWLPIAILAVVIGYIISIFIREQPVHYDKE